MYSVHCTCTDIIQIWKIGKYYNESDPVAALVFMVLTLNNSTCTCICSVLLLENLRCKFNSLFPRWNLSTRLYSIICIFIHF